MGYEFLAQKLWELSAEMAVGSGTATFGICRLSHYQTCPMIMDREIMHLHHQKHHNTYVTNFNQALEKLDQAMSKGDSSSIVKLQNALKFNGGGLVAFD